MDVLMIVLRLIHVFSGVFWAGASFFMLSFVSPTAAAIGPEGQKFMQHLSFRTRFAAAMAGVAILTVVSGLVMYGYLSGFRTSWATSGYGLTLTLGGIAGIIAFGTGYFMQNRGTARMKALAETIQASGGPPAPAQLEEMGAHAAFVAKGAQITAIFLALALVGMSVAQYIFF